MSKRNESNGFEVLAALLVVIGLVYLVYRAFVPNPKTWVSSWWTRFIRYIVLQLIFVRYIVVPVLTVATGGAIWEPLHREHVIYGDVLGRLGFLVVGAAALVIVAASLRWSHVYRGKPLPGRPQGRDLTSDELHELRRRAWHRVWASAREPRRFVRLLLHRVCGTPPGAGWYARELPERRRLPAELDVEYA